MRIWDDLSIWEIPVSSLCLCNSKNNNNDEKLIQKIKEALNSIEFRRKKRESVWNEIIVLSVNKIGKYWKIYLKYDASITITYCDISVFMESLQTLKLHSFRRLDQFCFFETFKGFLLPSERLPRCICQKFFFFKVQMESTRTLQAYLKVCPSGRALMKTIDRVWNPKSWIRRVRVPISKSGKSWDPKKIDKKSRFVK